MAQIAVASASLRAVIVVVEDAPKPLGAGHQLVGGFCRLCVAIGQKLRWWWQQAEGIVTAISV
jgi:hypothetical protein